MRRTNSFDYLHSNMKKIKKKNRLEEEKEKKGSSARQHSKDYMLSSCANGLGSKNNSLSTECTVKFCVQTGD